MVDREGRPRYDGAFNQEILPAIGRVVVPLAQHPTTFTGRKKLLVAMVPLLVLSAWFYYIWAVSGVLSSVEKYPNGAIKSEGYVQRARMGEYHRTGHWVTYFPTGKKESEGSYVKGKKEGAWKLWNEQGEALPSVDYHDGQPASPTSNQGSFP